MKKWITMCLMVGLSHLMTRAQVTAGEIENLAEASLLTSLDQFRLLLSLPNDAYLSSSLEPNIQWIQSALLERGFATERLPTDGIDLVLAEKEVMGSPSTVLIYLQLDGQPVDPSKWDQADPYIPALKRQPEDDHWEEIPWESLKEETNPEWRIFARSSSDAKGPVAAFLTAYDILLDQSWIHNYSVKIIIDSEEELGSPNLPQAVEKYRDRLAADMLIILDGPRHNTNQPTLTFGARGITTVRLTTYGPRVPQHSGHYGNYAPNPALHLAQLLASMKDNQGKVIIPGFYHGIEIDEATRQILRQVPDDEAAIQDQLGIAEPDQVAPTYQESIQYPSLNIRGMASAWVGTKVRTIIPDAAVANLDIRTVKESDPERLVGLLIQHIREQGYHICKGEPTEEERMTYARLVSLSCNVAYGAYRTPFDAKVGLWLDRALTRTFGKPPIKIRTSGGSIPIAPFVQTLGIPAVTVPTVNRDNNQHSPNENIRLGNYRDAIRTFLGILTEPLNP